MTHAVAPPLEPMLAKSRKEIPDGPGWVYEPKWDGFRALVWRDSAIEVISRDGRPLNRYFPELVAALEGLPAESVVDGEIVIGTESGLDFDALQQRIHPAESRVNLLAGETPASFLVFDLLALGRENLMAEPMSKRRSRLIAALGTAVEKPESVEEILSSLTGKSSLLMLTPQISSADEAVTWLTRFEDFGLDGVVAKSVDEPYSPGKRTMVKVKRERTTDCVVGGYRPHKSGRGIGSLLLGLYGDDGVLHYVGHTSSFKADERVAVLSLLEPHVGGESFGAGRTPGSPSRWTGGRDPSWVAVEPVLVCEVAFDRMMSGRFRHAARFVRWRTDKPPGACTFDQG